MDTNDKIFNDILKNGTVQEKASVWCDLNSSTFPEKLSHLKTVYDGLPNHTSKHEYVWSFMSRICDQIGMKECLREWNKNRMTNEEFETWWAKDSTPKSLIQ